MFFSAKSTKAGMWARPRPVGMRASHGEEPGTFPHWMMTPASMSTTSRQLTRTLYCIY